MINPNAYLADKIAGVLEAYGLAPGLPDNDPEELHRHADAWDAYAGQLRQIQHGLNDVVQELHTNSWTGTAAAAQYKVWEQQYRNSLEMADQAEQLARALRDHATHASSVTRTVIGLVLEIIETEIAGLLLAAFTGFASEAVATARAGILIARLVLVISRFKRAVEAVSAALRGAGLAGRALAGTIALTKPLLRDGAVVLAGTTAFQAVSGREVTWKENLQMSAFAAVGTVGMYRAFDRAVPAGLRALGRGNPMDSRAALGCWRPVTKGQAVYLGVQEGSAMLAVNVGYGALTNLTGQSDKSGYDLAVDGGVAALFSGTRRGLYNMAPFHGTHQLPPDQQREHGLLPEPGLGRRESATAALRNLADYTTQRVRVPGLPGPELVVPRIGGAALAHRYEMPGHSRAVANDVLIATHYTSDLYVREQVKSLLRGDGPVQTQLSPEVLSEVRQHELAMTPDSGSVERLPAPEPSAEPAPQPQPRPWPGPATPTPQPGPEVNRGWPVASSAGGR